MFSDSDLRLRYDSIWENSIESIRSGAVEIDPILAKGEGDARRGMTLRIRPPLAIQKRVQGFLQKLQQEEPEQHYYRSTELHVTFLSLFTATINAEPFFAKKAEYVAAVNAWVGAIDSFFITFRGVTASLNAIMVQGFVDAKTLNGARDQLRAELRLRGLGSTLDSRYRLETAHMTVARYLKPLKVPTKFAETLTRHRAFDFGEFEVRQLELVKNDWYQSHGTVEFLRIYDL